MIQYLVSLFSLKKLFYKCVSIFAYWDKDSSFTKETQIRRFSKLKNSHIGKYSRINPGCKLAYVTVGNFCAIGKDTEIGLGQHPLNLLSTHSVFYKTSAMRNDWVKPINFPPRPIIIGNDVWIGIRCLILDGVTVGDGAVIGAGSVVTKDVPPYAIIGGAPAKIIKYRFDQAVIDRLLKIQWWNLSDEEISKQIGIFGEPEITIELLDKYFPNA